MSQYNSGFYELSSPSVKGNSETTANVCLMNE